MRHRAAPCFAGLLLCALASFAGGCEGEIGADPGLAPDRGLPADAGLLVDALVSTDLGVAADAEPAGPHVVELPATSGFERKANGSYRLARGSDVTREVGRAFYAQQPDDYDFLIVWSDFVIDGDFWAYTDVIKYDIAGLGFAELFGGDGGDATADAGSAGRLQAICLMNGKDLYAGNQQLALDITTHEVGHRWLAYATLPSQADPTVLLDDVYGGHWSMFVGLGGPSAVGYHHTVDNGDGTFTSRAAEFIYSPWELYFMGLRSPQELPDLFFVAQPRDFSQQTDAYGEGWGRAAKPGAAPVTFKGTKVVLTPPQVIQELGPRVPSFEQAAKRFRFAFVLLCEPSQPCAPETVAWVDAIRKAWSATFAAASANRGAAVTTLTAPRP